MAKITFHCFYDNPDSTTRHVQELEVKDIPKWIRYYKYTHPACTAVSVKIWFHDSE